MIKVCVVLSAAGVLMSGCQVSSSFQIGGTPSLAAEELAAQVKQSIQDASRNPVSSAQCDGALKGEIGATQRCKLTATDNSSIGVTVTTTKIEDGQISFHIKVDDHAVAAR